MDQGDNSGIEIPASLLLNQALSSDARGFASSTSGISALIDDSAEILASAGDWRREGHGVALATVIATWGSSPRPVGSRLATDTTGRILGSVSGGCVEGAVIEAAAEVIRTGHPRLMAFGVANETAWSLGLACGGQVRIFVEALG